MTKTIWKLLFIVSLLIFNAYAHAKHYKFKEDNYSIKLDNSWSLNEKFDQNIAQMFVSTKNKQTFIVRKLPLMLLENDTLPNSKKAFIQFLNDNYLESQKSKIFSMMENYFAIKPLKIIGKDSFLATMIGNNKNTPVSLSISIIKQENNTGYLFTLVNISNEEITKAEIQALTKDFKLLKSPKKLKQYKIKLKPSAKTIQSHYYGYEVPYYKGMISTNNTDIGLSKDESLFNHIQISTKHGYSFMVASFCNENKPIDEQQVLSYFTEDQEDVSEAFTINKDKNGGYYAKGKLFDKQIKQLVYYYKVKTFEFCQHIVIFFDIKDHGLKPLTDFVNQMKEIPVNHSLLSKKELEKQNTMHALLQNALGIFDEEGNRDSSYYHFKKAHELAPNDPLYLDNFISTANSQKKYQQGLDVLNNINDTLADSETFISWKAWFLANTENQSLAIKEYKKLFDKTYTNDEDFFNYIELLERKKQWQEIIEILMANKAHVSKQKSLELKLATAFAKNKNIEKTKDILTKITTSENFEDYGFYDVMDIYFDIKAYDEGH